MLSVVIFISFCGSYFFFVLQVPTHLAARYVSNMDVNESKFRSFLELDLDRIGNVDITKIKLVFLVIFYICH